MAKKPLISIIIPVYNAENYIEECLNSLTSQTYENIEILCTDDCSTDNSALIIEELMKKDSRIKLFKHKINSGPATARNTGLDRASGEYIMFCDNDDTYKPTMCEKMLNAIINENVDIVTCRANVINADFDKPQVEYVNSQPFGKYFLCNKIMPCVNVLLWNKIFKKSIIDKYEIRFPDGLSSEDDVFCIEYLAVAKDYFGIYEELYNYKLRKSSYTYQLGRKNLGKKKYDKIEVLKIIYYFLEKNNIIEKCLDFYRVVVAREITYLFEYNRSFFIRREIIKRYNKFIKNTVLKNEPRSLELRVILERFLKCYWF